MAVAHDASSKSTPVYNAASLSWTHTPVGTPKGVLVFATNEETATEVPTGITYGGVALSRVTGGAVADGTGEAMRVTAWFLGSSIPTGPQSIVMTLAVTLTMMRGYCATVTAVGDTAIVGTPVLLNNDGTLAEQNVDSGADDALRYAMIASGLETAPTIGANSTLLQSSDTGTDYYALVRETTGGSGSRPVGMTSGTSEDRACVYLAIKDLSGGGGGGGSTARSFAVIG